MGLSRGPARPLAFTPSIKVCWHQLRRAEHHQHQPCSAATFSQVTRYTSALTLQVLGNAKGVFTTALSIFIFRNPFTVTSVGGYLITVAVGLSRYHAAAAATSYLAHALRDLPARIVTNAAWSAGRGLLCSSQAVSDCTEDQPHQHTRLTRRSLPALPCFMDRTASHSPPGMHVKRHGSQHDVMRAQTTVCNATAQCDD